MWPWDHTVWPWDHTVRPCIVPSGPGITVWPCSIVCPWDQTVWPCIVQSGPEIVQSVPEIIQSGSVSYYTALRSDSPQQGLRGGLVSPLGQRGGPAYLSQRAVDGFCAYEFNRLHSYGVQFPRSIASRFPCVRACVCVCVWIIWVVCTPIWLESTNSHSFI